MHFYPGQNLLIVRKQSGIVWRFEGWGGPASIINNPPDMPAEPTSAGCYVIDKAEPYRTPSWALHASNGARG